MSIDWGDIPTWIAAMGAFVALIFARRAANSAKETSDLQARQIAQLDAEIARRDLDQKRGQASKVAVYLRVKRREEPDFEPRRVGATPVVRYVNTSGLPVYELTVFCFTPRARVKRFYHVLGPPDGEKRDLRLVSEKLSELFPTYDAEWMSHATQLQAACCFRDAEGLWWYRVEGKLASASNPKRSCE